MKRLDPDAAVRLDRKTQCLLWTGWKNGDGYGMWRPPGARSGRVVHRWFWERVHGPIPDGMTIDHLCNVRACQNVEHMQLASPVENTKLGAKRRPVCPRCGGPWSHDGRQRVCRACMKAYFAEKDQEPERKEKRQAAFTERYRSDPAFRAQIREYQRDYYRRRRGKEGG